LDNSVSKIKRRRKKKELMDAQMQLKEKEKKKGCKGEKVRLGEVGERG
jgi:hypothetical protein